MIPITIDIETIPDQRPDALGRIRADVIADFRAPSTLTKEQAAIDLGLTDKDVIKFTSKDAMLRRWEQELAASKSGDVAEDKWRRTALNGAAGEIVCIGVKIGDGDVTAIYRDPLASESTLLRSFFDLLGEFVSQLQFDSYRFVGHNIESFDLRFIWQRAVILGVKPPIDLVLGKYSRELFDTMTTWAGHGNRISLDDLCRALEVPSPKGDMDGSKVWDYVKAGRTLEVAEYCKADVEATYQCYRRMTFAELL